ncbi:TolC family protein [Escherichia coli]|uniref:TolC family protein n=1 Tax=Escherichia coli TaxID=562 RepID=UPI000B7E3DEB|nr:TolC family protein [Escherichia coli]HBB8986077.1 TolC family protein [Escherichia coli]
MKINALILSVLIICGCSHVKHTQNNSAILSLADNVSRTVKKNPESVIISKLRVFDDKQLFNLIHNVFLNNNDLIKASLRLKEAEIQYERGRLALFPDFSSQTSFSETRGVKQREPQSRIFSSDININYEIDLWGKLSDVNNQRQWEMIATAYDYQASMLTIAATAAKYYWEISLINSQLENYHKRIQIVSATKYLVMSEFKAGVKSELDVLTVHETMSDLQSSIYTLEKQKELSKNALSILLNRKNLNNVFYESKLAEYKPIEINNDSDISSVLFRPDVQSAAATLKSQSYATYSVWKEMLPTFSLNFILNSTSSLLSEVFNNPLNTVRSEIALPFFNWLKKNKEIEVAKIKKEQYEVDFVNVVNKSINELRDFNAEINTISKNIDIINDKLKNQKHEMDIYRSMYEAGVISLKSYLSVQEKFYIEKNEFLKSVYDYYYANLKFILAQGLNEE